MADNKDPSAQYTLLDVETRNLRIMFGPRAGHVEDVVTKRFVPVGKPDMWAQKLDSNRLRKSLLDVVTITWRRLPDGKVQQDISATGRTVCSDGRASGVSQRFVAFCDHQPAPLGVAELAVQHNPHL